jgi:hypothetical protein
MADHSVLMIPTSGDELAGTGSHFQNLSTEILILIFENVSALMNLALPLLIDRITAMVGRGPARAGMVPKLALPLSKIAPSHHTISIPQDRTHTSAVETSNRCGN